MLLVVPSTSINRVNGCGESRLDLAELAQNKSLFDRVESTHNRFGRDSGTGGMGVTSEAASQRRNGGLSTTLNNDNHPTRPPRTQSKLRIKLMVLNVRILWYAERNGRGGWREEDIDCGDAVNEMGASFECHSPLMIVAFGTSVHQRLPALHDLLYTIPDPT